MVVAASLAILLTSLSVPALAADGQAFVTLANQKRAAHGLAPVGWSSQVDQVAVERGNQMAKRDRLEHDMAYVQRRLKELGVCFTGYGEIIYWERGYPSFDPARAVNAWYKSTSGHKEIMLGNYNAAAGSWSKNTSSNGVYAVMIFIKTCGTPPPPPDSDPGESIRIAGSDRYATAAAVSRASYPAGVAVAYVATGQNFPDALAAGPAATAAGGPVLLVKRTEIPAATATELGRLRPGRIVVLGASGAVSDGTLTALRKYTTSGKVSRVAGADRYATAAAISKAHFPAGVAVVYLATGANFPDALSGGALAGAQGGPILLVKKSEIPAATSVELKRLNPGRVVILGSTAVISEQVGRSAAAVTGATVSRLAGSDRYVTAVKVSQSEYAAGEPTTVYVATGASFPDGLAGSPPAGKLPGPLLLVPSSSLPSGVAAELTRLAPDRVVVLGGHDAISSTVVQAINAAVP